MLTRRTMFAGLGGLLVTPAIVRASSLMKLSVSPPIVAPLEPWYRGAGFMRGVYPEQIARDIVSVQPIDPAMCTNLLKAIQNLESWYHSAGLMDQFSDHCALAQSVVTIAERQEDYSPCLPHPHGEPSKDRKADRRCGYAVQTGTV